MHRITLGDSGEDYLDYRPGSGNTVEIYDIAVRTERRCGRGSLLIRQLLEEHLPDGTRLVWAITRADNIGAQHFYESLHFRVVGVLRNFYCDNPLCVDAILYGRDV